MQTVIIMQLNILFIIYFLFLVRKSLTLDYPEVPRDIEDYHGVHVADPYRFLEELESQSTKKFVEQQTLLLNEYLESLPNRQNIYDKLTTLVDYTRFGSYIKRGESSPYFHFFNEGLQPLDIIVRQDELTSPPEVFLDPNTLSEDGSISLGYYNGFSPQGKTFVYSLSYKGSGWLTGHFRDVETSQDFPDILEDIMWPEFSFGGDGSGVFYSKFPRGEDGQVINKNSQIYFHKIGQPQENDTFIYQNSEEESEWFLFAEVSHDGEYLVVKPQPDFIANAVILVELNEDSEVNSEFLQIFSEQDGARYIYITNEDQEFYFLSNYKAPNFQIIRKQVNIQNGTSEESQIFVEEHSKNILKWVAPFDNDKLVLCYFEDVKHKLEIRKLNDASLVSNIELPIGVISDYHVFKESAEFFFKFENLISPGTIYRCDENNENNIECVIIRDIKIAANLTNFMTEQIFYESKDGTVIPMYVAHKKDIELDGQNPALLLGYGGFNVDLLPTFSPFYFEFIEYFGGVFASANIRGGAEYGEQWHQDGILLNKQNSFDDFISGAEYLIEKGYTSSPKLVIEGSSNGGLLVAACVNQRPELFGVALPDVGLMDMLRYHKSSIGFAWCSEYGCSDNETHFHNLYSYSPLHNIKAKEDSQYPAILVSTASHDERVLPSHSFKYLAELQHTIGQHDKETNPFLLKVTENAGHDDENTPIAEKIQGYTDSFSFIEEKFRKDAEQLKNSGYMFSTGVVLIKFLVSLIILG